MDSCLTSLRNALCPQDAHVTSVLRLDGNSSVPAPRKDEAQSLILFLISALVELANAKNSLIGVSGMMFLY